MEAQHKIFVKKITHKELSHLIEEGKIGTEKNIWTESSFFAKLRKLRLLREFSILFQRAPLNGILNLLQFVLTKECTM